MLEASEIKSRMPHIHHAMHFSVGYCAGQLRGKMQRYVDCALDELKKLNLPPKDEAAPSSEQEIFFYTNGGIYLHSMLHKHPAYRREEEYRFLISGGRDAFTGHDYHRVRERNREIVGYLKVPIPMWKSPGRQGGALTHVRIGPAASDQLVGQIWTALRSFGISVSGPNISKSDIPYRSN